MRGQELTDAVLFGYVFDNVTENHTIHVQYTVNAYILSITQEGEGELVADKDILNVKHGEDVEFTVKADFNKVTAFVYVDGQQTSLVDGKFTLKNITKDIKIKVDFVGKGFLETTLGKIIVIGSVVAIISLIVAIKLIRKSKMKKMESSNNKIFDLLNMK